MKPNYRLQVGDGMLVSVSKEVHAVLGELTEPQQRRLFQALKEISLMVQKGEPKKNWPLSIVWVYGGDKTAVDLLWKVNFSQITPQYPRFSLEGGQVSYKINSPDNSVEELMKRGWSAQASRITGSVAIGTLSEICLRVICCELPRGLLKVQLDKQFLGSSGDDSKMLQIQFSRVDSETIVVSDAEIIEYK